MCELTVRPLGEQTYTANLGGPKQGAFVDNRNVE